MLIGYSLSDDWSYTITDDTFVTDAAALCDRKPGQRVMFLWPAGSQTIATTSVLQATRTLGIIPRVVMLAGCDLPVGLKVELTGKLASGGGFDVDLGGNSETQRLVRLPGGGTGCVWVLDAGIASCNGFQVTFYNDVGGVTAIAAEAELLLGELTICAAVEMCITPEWSERWTIASQTHRNPSGQTDLTFRTPYREVTLRGVPAQDSAWSAELPNDMDWQLLHDALAIDPYTIIVPDHTDVTLSQRQAVFGIVGGLGISTIIRAIQRPDEMKIQEVPSGEP